MLNASALPRAASVAAVARAVPIEAASTPAERLDQRDAACQGLAGAEENQLVAARDCLGRHDRGAGDRAHTVLAERELYGEAAGLDRLLPGLRLLLECSVASSSSTCCKAVTTV